MAGRTGLFAVSLALAMAAALSPAGAQAQTRERGSAAPGPRASPLAFQGGWQVLINRTEAYTLVIQIANAVVDPLLNDLYVTGQLIRTDGATQYNGNVQGVIPRGTSTLNFSFSQPGVNRGGSGVLILSSDAAVLTGNSKSGEVYSTWRGTRAK